MRVIRWAAPAFLFLAAGASGAAPDKVVLEIRVEGGYRDAAAPDPFVLVRVESDGRLGAHCPDFRWVEDQLEAEPLQELTRTLLQSGFFDLKGGVSGAWAWWRRWQDDAGLTVYSARANGKKKVFRHSSLGAHDPAPLGRLREAAEGLRQRLCGAGSSGPSAAP